MELKIFAEEVIIISPLKYKKNIHRLPFRSSTTTWRLRHRFSMFFSIKRTSYQLRRRSNQRRLVTNLSNHRISCYAHAPQLLKFPKTGRWYVRSVFWVKHLTTPIQYSRMTQLHSYNLFWSKVWAITVNHRLVHFLKSRLTYVLKKRPLFDLLKNPISHLYWGCFLRLCRFYKTLVMRSYLNFSYYLYHKKHTPATLYNYKLYFTFSPNRFYINLCNWKGLNYLSLSIGLLLKFFKHQKALKKNKALKFLLVKFLRKLLLVSKINDLTIFIKRPPVLLTEVFKFLLSPLPSPFHDPISNLEVFEEGSQVYFFRVWYLFFLKTVSYTSMKQKQKGRLKRKITKKVISKNRITDEA
jgi:hypothetical protein